MNVNSNSQSTRVDLLLLADMVEPDSRVLDVGCGDGTLLRILAETRNVDARGVEISQSNVNQCVARGLSVVQGDADTDLINYPDNAFVYTILSQTIQLSRRGFFGDFSDRSRSRRVWRSSLTFHFALCL